MTNFHRIISFLFVFIIAFSSCKISKKLTQTKPLEEKKIDYLVQKMDSCRFKFEWLSAKISASVTMKDNSNSFSASLRMRNDSMIWLSISALGIEVARMQITQDTSKLIDRINSRYAITNFNSLNNLLQLSLDFNMFESLLLGNYFSYFDEKKLKSSYIDGENYVVSTLRRRKLKRSIEKEETMKRFVQDFWLDSKTFRVVKTVIDDNKTKRKLTANYENFIMVDSMQLASKVTINIQSENLAQLIFEWSKVNINKPQEFPFSIPEKYEKMR